MKKLKILLPVFLVITLFLSGCGDRKDGLKGKLEGAVRKKMWDQAGLSSDQDYKEYLKMKTDGQLNPDGVYGEIELTDIGPEERPGQVRVTFAKNAFIDAHYYRDEACTEQIDPENCFLNPGDAVYVSEPRVYNAHTNLYRLDRFRVYEYLDDGTRGPELECTEETDGLVLRIPDEYEGTELAVVPVGSYEMRTLSLTADFRSADGKPVPPEGTWYVNDKPVTGRTVKISPVTSYSVRYEYDGTRYRLISADPAIFFENGENGESSGIVIFREAEALDDTRSYTVELRQYAEETKPEETEADFGPTDGWHVTLDDSDDYGIVVYRLDGTAVSGPVVLKGSEKLTMEYTLIDERYEIVHENEGIAAPVLDFIEGIFGRRRVHVSIPVSDVLDDTTVTRGDYVRLQEKEE